MQPKLPRLALVLVWMVTSPGLLGDEVSSGVSSDEILLISRMGGVVRLATNQLPASVMPPASMGVHRQFPELIEGFAAPDVVRDRHAAALTERDPGPGWGKVPPLLMPYLAPLDEFGNTALKPGALFPVTVFDAAAQRPKYWLSEGGFRYKLAQNVTGITMTDVVQGDNAMGFYAFDLRAKWSVIQAPAAGAAGWVTAQIEAKTGLGDNGMSQNPADNLGVINSPNDTWSSRNGFRIPELGWQQSLADGRLVAVAGVVSQRNYMDRNGYAESAHTGFMNSALVHSQVLPLPEYNFGLNLQWQPRGECYAMLGASAGQAKAGQLPWQDFNWDNWSVLGELGYVAEDLLGLGPGVYRVQPFIAQQGGPVQGGVCFNLQQQLGHDVPWGWFGRFGFGGEDVTAAAAAQAATGVMVRGPLAELGLLPSRRFDFAGLGLIWSQPSAASQPVEHENEYALETGYVLQLTPTTRLQPDLQLVWNPAFNPDPGPALVFQLQLDILW